MPVDPKTPLKITLASTVYEMPRPTSLQLDVSRIANIRSMISGYYTRYLAAEKLVIASGVDDDSANALEEMNGCLILIEKLNRDFTRRLKFWLASAHVPALVEFCEKATDPDDMYDQVYAQALAQLTGGETTIKNL